MANLENARCPNCGKIANSKKDVEKLFGTRTQLGKYETVQSWCIDCRAPNT